MSVITRTVFRPLPDDWAEHDAWAPPVSEVPAMLFTDGRKAWLGGWHAGAWRCEHTHRALPSGLRGWAPVASLEVELAP